MKFDRISSGAIAVTAILALGVGGCANMWGSKTEHAKTDTSANPRGPVQTTEDAAINSKVKLALAADEMVKAHHINVDTVRGVVTLNGTVNSAAEKAQAIKVARSVSGVVDVRDNLKTSG
jgi:osmotically-inducible protein OsmY